MTTADWLGNFFSLTQDPDGTLIDSLHYIFERKFQIKNNDWDVDMSSLKVMISVSALY